MIGQEWHWGSPELSEFIIDGDLTDATTVTMNAHPMLLITQTVGSCTANVESVGPTSIVSVDFSSLPVPQPISRYALQVDFTWVDSTGKQQISGPVVCDVVA